MRDVAYYLQGGSSPPGCSRHGAGDECSKRGTHRGHGAGADGGVFSAERVFGAGPGRPLDVLARRGRRRGCPAELGALRRRPPGERVFALLSTLALLALLTRLRPVAPADPTSESAPRLATVLQIAAGRALDLPLLLGELAYAGGFPGPGGRGRRVQDAVGTGVVLLGPHHRAGPGVMADVRDVWRTGATSGPADPAIPPGASCGPATAAGDAHALLSPRLGGRGGGLRPVAPPQGRAARRRGGPQPRPCVGVSGNGAIAISRGERDETYSTGLALDASRAAPRVEPRGAAPMMVARAPKIR